MLAIEQYTRRLLKDFHPIVAANRPPVDLAHDPADRTRFVRGAGGLVTGLSGLAQATGAVWVASVRDGLEGELEVDGGGEPMMVETTDGSRFQVSWVNPPRLAYDLYYNTIANPLLWFVQHYLWNLAEVPVLDDSTHLAWNEGYRRVNQLFAQQVVREARRGRKRPLVLSHDYHLYLVPRMVRRELPDAVLQHFVHIPWPTPQYWKVLPSYMREEIMDGLLAADVVGLQTHSDVRNFLLTCEENMGLPVDFRQQTAFYRGRTIWVRRYPISIDVREFEIYHRFAIDAKVVFVDNFENCAGGHVARHEVAVLGVALLEEVEALGGGDLVGVPGVALLLGHPDPAALAAHRLAHQAQLVLAGDRGGVDLDEFAVGVVGALLVESGLGRAGADDGVGGLAEDGSVAACTHNDRVCWERPGVHGAEVHGGDAAAGAFAVEDCGEELPAFVLGYFAFGLVAADLFVEGVEELLACRCSRKSCPVI